MKRLILISILCGVLISPAYGETLRSGGDVYVGDVSKGVPHGQGTATLADGETYVGEWKNDKQHGQGTGTYSDGQKFVGEFKDGYSWDGFGYDKDGSVLATISKGHVQTD